MFLRPSAYTTMRISVISFNGAPLPGPLGFDFDSRGGAIGREEDNELTLPDPERHISRVQARIEFDGANFVFVDTGGNPSSVERPAGGQGQPGGAHRGRAAVHRRLCARGRVRPRGAGIFRIPTQVASGPRGRPTGPLRRGVGGLAAVYRPVCRPAGRPGGACGGSRAAARGRGRSLRGLPRLGPARAGRYAG